MGFIDAHVHVWTPDTAHYPLAPGIKREEMKPPSFTPEQLFRHTKPAGVDRINLIQVYFYGFDNSYMLDMMALYPEVFVGTAVVDPLAEQPEKQMSEMSKKRVRAFRIHADLSKLPPARWLEPAGYSRMFEVGAKNNLAMSCLIAPEALPELDRMCRKFPATPVIIDHLCRIGLDGSIRDQDVDALCAMAEHKRTLVKVGLFYALGKKRPPYTDMSPLIQKVVKAFGARRCMWESAFPPDEADHKYQDSIDLICKRLDFLTAEDKEWMLQRTAEEFFFKN